MTYLACHYVHDNSVSFLSMNIIGQASIVADQNKGTLLDIMSGFRNYYRIIRTGGALALVVLLAGLAVCVVVYKFRWTQNIPIR
jgi:hypothetical protein